MKWIGALAISTAIGGGFVQSAPAACGDQGRRTAAIKFAQAINNGEAAAFRGQRSYSQLTDLPVGSAPADMTVQLSTDGETYAFSIKDALDPCHGAVFSDQTGVVYAGAPIR